MQNGERGEESIYYIIIINYYNYIIHVTVHVHVHARQQTCVNLISLKA